MKTQETCPVCKFQISFRDDGDGRYSKFCSGFCAEATPAELEAFKTLEPGQFGVFPCVESGCIVEGDYDGPETACSTCDVHRRARISTEIITAFVDAKSSDETTAAKKSAIKFLGRKE